MRLIDVSAALPSAAEPARDAEFATRTRAAAVIGITTGIQCATEPAHLESMDAIALENAVRRTESLAEPDRTAWYVAVSPAHPAHARREISEGRDAIGIELVGPLVEDAPALDDIVEDAERRRLPVRCAAAEITAALAGRHPRATFILAHLGDGGRWHSALNTVAPWPNILVDVSGRVAERGMFDAVIFETGSKRVLWGTGATMETGLAQLRALAVIAPGTEIVEAIRWRNAARIFGLASGSP